MHLSSQNVNSITVSKTLNHFGWESFLSDYETSGSMDLYFKNNKAYPGYPDMLYLKEPIVIDFI